MTFIEKWRELAQERANEALSNKMDTTNEISKRLFETINQLNIGQDVKELISELDEVDGAIEGILIEEIYSSGLSDGLKSVIQK